MDGADQELFARSLRHATERHTGAALDAALVELGWPDALAVDPRIPTSTFFELQGRAGAASSALDRVVAAGVGLGPVPGGVVLPSIGSVAAPAEPEDGRLTVRGIATAGLGSAGPVLVVAHRADGHDAVLVDADALRRRPVEGIDPALGLLEVRGVVGDGSPAGPVAWRAGVALGQRAVGHELVGAGRRMLELARDHALDRIQFGVPVASFQAVRHRLADTLVALEVADALLDAAWLDPSPTRSAMAKVAAGRGARTAARHCQQVLAGVGFTTEHDLHRHIRRTLVLEQVLGAPGALTRALGEEARRRRLPTPLAL